jgi:hydrogen peroxide-dependent heme synthase
MSDPAAPTTADAVGPVTPSEGVGVLHLFCKPTVGFDGEAAIAAVKAAQAEGTQVVSVAMLGHKCDAGFMAIDADLRKLRALQTGLQHAGFDVVDSYVSMSEYSEYTQGMPEEMRRVRLYPTIPPADMPAWCFYPMSKKREGSTGEENWFRQSYERRHEMMMEHGKSGRTFAGRIGQYITGSCGVDDFEWGVTLFGKHPDDLKAAVYTMRYDEASAIYGIFGTFYTGMVTPIEELVRAI